ESQTASSVNRRSATLARVFAPVTMAERKAELLLVPYFHIVFTPPAEIGAIAYQNKAEIYGLLFKAASETMLTIATDPQQLGAKIGITAVLHTWGSAMTHHPHVHMAASHPMARAGSAHDRTIWSPSRSSRPCFAGACWEC